MIGRTVSHYRITAQLGTGGMGVVYKAHDTKLDRMVALKFLPHQPGPTDEQKARFLQEAKSVSALDHTNICTIYEIDETEDGQIFIAMGYYAGESLAERLKRGHLSTEDAVDIAVQLARGLSKAHASGIIHRDIKPANIIITEDNEAKIVDFGLAKLLDQTRITREGAAVGTVMYMSPEQAQGKDADHRTDLWALGVVLYEMLTGISPFAADHEQAILYRIINESPAVPSSVREGVPPVLDALVSRALEKSRDARPESADEFRRELERLHSSPTSASRGRRRSLYPLVGGVLTVAVLLALVFIADVGGVRSRLFGNRTEAYDRADILASAKLAVLPFEDFSSRNDRAWVAAGMHEALLTALQQIDGLRVISRTSAMRYRGTEKLIADIASELGVRWLVEGSVVSAGDRIKINAKLIDGPADEQVWAGQYERDAQDILALQNDVARVITKEVQATVTPEEEQRLARAQPVDPEAYGAYVLGLNYFDRVTPGDFERSVELFQESIARDSTFPDVHAALAVAYGIAVEYNWVSKEQGATAAQRAAETALRLDPQSGHAHHALASVQFHMLRNFDAAEQSYRKALQLASDASIYFGFGWLLSQMGRHEEAVQALERAVELDPRSPGMHCDLGWWLYGDRQFDRAIAEAQVCLGLDASYAEGYWLLAAAYAQKGEFEQAFEEMDRYESLYGQPVYWFRGYLLGLAGRREQAEECLARLQQRVERGEAPSILAAQIYLGLGDYQRVLQVLEASDDASVSFQPYLWPEYESLFTKPRFLEVLTRFGVPLPAEFRR